jgi:cell division protein FtsZ
MTPSAAPAGERLVVPQAQAPAQPATQQPASQQSHTNGSGVGAGRASTSANGSLNGGGITVPPLPPIPGPVAGRRPLSNEDFEEELDIPEFLRQ